MERSFRDRGLRCDVLLLSPRLPLAAVVRRQILEGVQAVVKLTRQAQFSGKIPLQVFNRSGGVDNVQFDGGSSVKWSTMILVETDYYTEYDNLEAHIAAELVIRAKQTHGAPTSAAYGVPPPSYGVPQFAQPQPQPVQQQTAQQPHPTAPSSNLTSLITSLDGPTLQKLLGAMGQSQPSQAPQQHIAQHQLQASAAASADLASLLAGAAREQPQQQPYSQQQQQPSPQSANPYAAFASNPLYANNPGLAALLGGAGGRPQQQGVPPSQQQQPQSGQQVHNIMEQLARWKQ